MWVWISQLGIRLSGLDMCLWSPQLESSLPPVQKMMVPTAAAVSGNRSVSFRPSLTPGGVGRFLDRTSRDTVSTASPLLSVYSPPTCAFHVALHLFYKPCVLTPLVCLFLPLQPSIQSSHLPDASPGPSQRYSYFLLSSSPILSLPGPSHSLGRERGS